MVEVSSASGSGFLQRVAEREGVSAEQAREHALAAFATLREAVEEEFFDIAVQLPNEYWVLPVGP
jgi:uncharacterized protein (DUF2267 family)